jgi:hypothetical protein
MLLVVTADLIIMVVTGLEQVEYTRPPGASGAALLFKVTTYGAGDTVFVNLADVFEQVALLGASVIPILEELLKRYSMGMEASGPMKTVKSPCFMPSAERRRWE